MKHCLIIFLLLANTAFSQSYQDLKGSYLKHDGLWPQKQFRLPSDTINNKLGVAVLNNNFYIGTGVYWKTVTGGATGAIFTQDVVVKGDAQTIVGKYKTGDTIPAAGKTIDEFLFDIATKAIPPTYNQPTVSVSTSAAFGTYEIGSNLGTINLNNTFTQNDAGTATTATYYQNGTPLGGNTTTISSLTTNQTFYVNRAYNQGACKNNNLGQQDCTGRINAGSVNSGNASYTVGIKYFMGACTGTQPTDAEIRAAAEQAFSSNRTQSNKNIAANNQRVFYAYLESYGALTRIFNSLGDFTLDANGFNPTTNTGFVNAQGFNTPLRIYTLQTVQGSAVNGLNFQ